MLFVSTRSESQNHQVHMRSESGGDRKLCSKLLAGSAKGLNDAKAPRAVTPCKNERRVSGYCVLWLVISSVMIPFPSVVVRDGADAMIQK